MAWISLTEAHVLTVLSGPELAGYRAAATATGQADPVQPALDQVTDLVRGFVGKVATLGAAGTIPSKLLAPALDLVAVRIMQRVGKNPADVRQKAADTAMSLLRSVAAGSFDIEEPTTPSTETSSVPSPAITPRTRRFTRADEEGL